MNFSRNLERAFKILIAINLLIPAFFVWFPPGLMAEADAIDYRLPLIDWALRHGQYPNFPWTYVDDFPALAELLMTATRAVVPWGPRIISVGGYVLFVCGVLRLSKIILPNVWALAATLLVAAMSVVTTQDNLIMVDLIAAAMTVWSLAYLLGSWRSNQYVTRHVVKAGLFAGAALATRYTQIPPVFTLSVLVLLIPVGNKFLGRLKALAVFSVCAVVVVLPWLIRNAVVNGNPVYPLFTPILGGANFQLDRHKEVFGMVAGMWGFGKSPVDFLLLPYRFAFYPDKFDYYVGPHTLMFLPWCAVFLYFSLKDFKSHADRIRYLSPLVAAFALLLSWFAVSQEGRFLIHIVPIGVVSGVAGIVVWDKFLERRFFNTVALIVLLVIGAGATAKHALKHKQELDPQTALLVPQLDAAQWLREHAGDDKVIIVQRTGNLAYANSDFIFVYPHVYSTSLYDYRHYQDLQQYCRDIYDLGVRYFYMPTGQYSRGLPLLEKCPVQKVFTSTVGGAVYAFKKI